MIIFDKIINLFKRRLLSPEVPQSERSAVILSEDVSLENFFHLRRDGYKTVCCSHCEESFEIKIKDLSDDNVFSFEVYTRKEPGKLGLLYIESFQREKGRPCGIGREMAIAIRKYAEESGFYKILLNPVAIPGEGNLSQEQLEKFYHKYLNGDKVRMEFVPNSDSLFSEGLPKLTS